MKGTLAIPFEWKQINSTRWEITIQFIRGYHLCASATPAGYAIHIVKHEWIEPNWQDTIVLGTMTFQTDSKKTDPERQRLSVSMASAEEKLAEIMGGEVMP